MDNQKLIDIVRRALAEWKACGMSDEEFAQIIGVIDKTQDGKPHRKFRLNGHISYARKHQGNYQVGKLKHQQHMKIAAHYLRAK
ncbi:hypothetical protein VSVS12_04071 [Vibrio scophthalmi]|uniref:hypothetical protein n=1 Tax=Vibrio scophthalmi TaxID=45658 RepID=UPI0008099165|nr:hypothetical protein [Vibrio scophthalmi]ANS87771.1 hypothetical protein VSVS12_04071 [Vibrio scophthalmi]